MRNTKKPIQLYRGTTQQHSDYAGPVGEITVDTEKYTVVVQNGVTGGVPLAREDTVVSLTNRIAAEESARATADTTLQNNIASEASSRATADTAIKKSVTDEVSARKAADTVLQKSITDEASARETADTAIKKSITDEASARETADNAFQKQIDNSLRRGAVIGEVRWFAMSTPPEGWLVCNGAIVFTSNYAALFAAIGKTFTPQLTSTDPDVENPEYSDPAVFRLPNLMGKVPWGSTSVGTVIEAGVPNIAGDTGSLNWSDNDSNALDYDTWLNSSGPYERRLFATNGEHIVPIYTQEPGLRRVGVNFNASRANPIYGRSDTVQPPALCLLPCIRYE